jgi:hypothetical protein
MRRSRREFDKRIGLPEEGLDIKVPLQGVALLQSSRGTGGQTSLSNPTLPA